MLTQWGFFSWNDFIKFLFLVTEEKLEKGEEESPEEPSPKGESVEDPAPPQELPSQKPDSELQCPPQEFEPKKKDKNREEWLTQEKKRDPEMYPPRKENQDRSSRRETVENKRQEDESKSKLIVFMALLSNLLL